MTTSRNDIIACLIVLLIGGLFAVVAVDFDTPPYEDAAILMRYADHLAQGHGIVWNIGEAPVDGATDFLFLLITAMMGMAGLSIETATQGTAVFCHFLTIVLIYGGIRSLFNANIPYAAFCALYFAFGPGLFISAAYFGTAFFALAVGIAWLAALRIICGSNSIPAMIIFSLLGLVTGLARPEGVLISIFMLAAVWMAMPSGRKMQLIICFGTIFLVLGGIYLTWRVYYFGYLLPNPFLKKGGGALYTISLLIAMAKTVILAGPFIPVYLVSLRSKSMRKLLLSVSLPILGSTFMWVLISGEMNYGSRFQYPILVMVLLSSAPFFDNLRSDFKLLEWPFFPLPRQALLWTAAGIAIIGILAGRAAYSLTLGFQTDGKYQVGLMLNRYADQNYTLATSEAGLLPFYSHWRTIDTWGLNDPWIARNGGITQAYLEKQHPQLVMWLEKSSSDHAPKMARFDAEWAGMVEQLKIYVHTNNYILSGMRRRNGHSTYYYYCSPRLIHKEEIIALIHDGLNHSAE